MAKILETSDLSGYQFEKEIMGETRSQNFSFDKIMQYTKSRKYLLFTNFICVIGNPSEISIKDIINTSEEIRNIIWQQYLLAKKMNSYYLIHNIGVSGTSTENESKIIFIEDIDLEWNVKIKEIIFKDKVEYLKWFKPINNKCKKDI